MALFLYHSATSTRMRIGMPREQRDEGRQASQQYSNWAGVQGVGYLDHSTALMKD